MTSNANPQVSIAVVGCGDRGSTYADWARRHPERARVVAVAEPRPTHLAAISEAHAIAPDRRFEDLADGYGDRVRQSVASSDGFHALCTSPPEICRLADMVVIATRDADHLAPALAFIEAGYDVLLEKPLAPTEAECRTIAEAAAAADVLFGVCHVLRYTPYTNTVKQAVESGLIGEIVSIQHLEPVGFWHQAHSFVRGNWRNTAESSFMLLTKACHDLDWLQYVVGQPIRGVSSFGGLAHFTRAHQPSGAADRCTECAVEPDCAYSAQRIYGGFLDRGKTGWPLDVLTLDPTPETVEQALREGPYGRCVYTCDNDVVDHQVVSMQFAGGASGVFTMSAFTQSAHRKTRIFGTKGELEGDGQTVRVFDFLTSEWTAVEPTTTGDATSGGGHGGGDDALMDAFVQAVATRDASLIRSGAAESLNSHLAVFAAERSRLDGRTVVLA